MLKINFNINFNKLLHHNTKYYKKFNYKIIKVLREGGVKSKG